MLLGGTLLDRLAALLAFAPRRGGAFGLPTAAAVVLAVLYAVPVMQRDIRPSRSSTALLFALLLAAVLWPSALQRRSAGAAAALRRGRRARRLALAPRSTREPAGRLRVDRAVAQRRGDDARSSGTTATARWTGRATGARCCASARAARVLEGDNLADFDGVRWRAGHRPGAATGRERSRRTRDWVQELRVVVRNLRTRQFVAAGTTLAIIERPAPAMNGAPGLYDTARPPAAPRPRLPRPRRTRPRPTDAAAATRAGSDVPRPRRCRAVRRDAAAAGATGSAIPDARRAARVVVLVVGRPGRPSRSARRGRRRRRPRAASSSTRRTRGLRARPAPARAVGDAVRLRARVQRYLPRRLHLHRDAAAAAPCRSTRSSPRQARLLPAVLGRDGAAAAHGRRARRASRAGFTPGTLDHERARVRRARHRRALVGRGVLPGQRLGDVRPDARRRAAARAGRRRRARAARTDRTVEGERARAGPPPDARARRRSGHAGAATSGAEHARRDRASCWRRADRRAALVALLVRRRRRRRGGAAHAGVDGELAELHRALRRSGRMPPPRTDARRARAAPAPAPPRRATCATLAAARYGYGDGRRRAAQRAALRRELAAGLGAARTPARAGGRCRRGRAEPAEATPPARCVSSEHAV